MRADVLLPFSLRMSSRWRQAKSMTNGTTRSQILSTLSESMGGRGGGASSKHHRNRFTPTN